MLQCKLCIQYFINFSLSLSLFFVCVHPSLLQIHPTLPNHHSITPTTTYHNSSQPMIFQSQNQPKQRKIKPKINLNPKSNLQWKTQQLRTQNQTFNKKPINPNPNRSRRCHHCHGELVVAMREERNKCLRATAKEKIKKKTKKKK